MDFFTHLLIGIVLGRLLFKDPNKQKVVALGSILPDFDVFLAWIPTVIPQLYIFSHRGLFHSLLTLLIFFPAVVLLLNEIVKYNKLEFIKNDMHIDLTINGYVFGVLGTYLHLFMDMLNPQGVVLLSPLFTKRYTFSTMNFIEPFVSIPSFLIIAIFMFKKYYKKQTINIPMFDNLSRIIGIVFVFFIALNSILLNQTIQSQNSSDTVPGLILVYRWVVIDKNNTYSVNLVNQFTQQIERSYTFQKSTYNNSELTENEANSLINKAKTLIEYTKYEFTLDPNTRTIVDITKSKEQGNWFVSFTDVVGLAQNRIYGLSNNHFFEDSVNLTVNI